MLIQNSSAKAECIAKFINQSPSIEGGSRPAFVMPRGKIVPQITERVLTGGGYLEERTFGPTQYIQTSRGPAVCFYKDYCYPAKDIKLSGCAIGQPNQATQIRLLNPASR